jgi:hypothetical protein
MKIGDRIYYERWCCGTNWTAEDILTGPATHMLKLC